MYKTYADPAVQDFQRRGFSQDSVEVSTPQGIVVKAPPLVHTLLPELHDAQIAQEPARRLGDFPGE